MARLNRRYRKKRRNPDGGSSPKANPPLLAEVGEFVIPGFAGFAITRFGTRVAATQIEQRKPEWGKHAGALASIGAFLAAWLLAHRWKWLAKYQTPLMVGSGIAALQSLIQLYVPKLGWMVADASPELNGSTTDPQLQGGSAQSMLPANMVPIDDDPNMYVYNDAYDGGRQHHNHHASGNHSNATAQATEDDYEDLAIDSAQESAQNMGIFSSN